jgi:hypothetical protein
MGLSFIANNYKTIIGLAIVGYWILNLAFFTTLNEDKHSNVSRPSSGELYPTNELQTRIDSTSLNTQKISASNDLIGWDSTKYYTGNSPACYNYHARFDKSINNRIEVHVGSETDVVIKLINVETNKSIRYTYIQGGDVYNIRHIPEGKYYLKIAYGRDWRQKIINKKCTGKFVLNSVYRKGDKIFDFSKIYAGIKNENGHKYRTYSIPYFILSLSVMQTDSSNRFQTNKISEENFND